MKNFAKHFKKLLIIPFLIPSIALAEFRHFNEWSTKEKAWFVGYQTFSWIDYAQTEYALTHPCDCYWEANPIYGRNPHPDKILLGNVLAAAAVYWDVGRKPENKRLWVLQAAAVSRVAVVYHNDSIGIDWRVAF